MTDFLVTVKSDGTCDPSIVYTETATSVTVKWSMGTNVTGFKITGLDSTFSPTNSGTNEVTTFNSTQSSPDGQDHDYSVSVSATGVVGNPSSTPRISNTSRP